MRSFFLHHPRETDLALFAGGELGPLARWRIERHLDKCARCQEDVSDFFHLQGDLDDLAETPSVDWQALAHRIKVAAAQAQPETEAVSLAAWFGRPAAWRMGVVSATALCAFVIYKQLPLVETDPQSAAISNMALEGALEVEGDQLGQTKASAPAEEITGTAFVDRLQRVEESAQKAGAAKDLDDAEPAARMLSESLSRKAKQVEPAAVTRVAAHAMRGSRRADGPAPAAPTTINRRLGGAVGTSSLVADGSEENLRSNTELASNEKPHRGASDDKAVSLTVDDSFKKESPRSLGDGRTGAYRGSPALSAQLQDVQSRDGESARLQPAQGPTSALDEIEKADLSASATKGRLRAALEKRSELGAGKNVPADPRDQVERTAGARNPVTLAVNKRPAESRIIGREAGAGERVAELEKTVSVSAGFASTAEGFENSQFSVLPAAWSDSNTEVGVAADGGVTIRALDSVTGTITITNVYLH